MNEMDSIRALTAFGKVGVEMLQARILSILALTGYLGLAGFVSYAPSWHGVALCGILALVAISAFRGENRFREPPKDPQ